MTLTIRQWCASCGQTAEAPIHTSHHDFTERPPTPVTPEIRAKYVAQYRDRAAENPGPTGDHLPPPSIDQTEESAA